MILYGFILPDHCRLGIVHSHMNINKVGFGIECRVKLYLTCYHYHYNSNHRDLPISRCKLTIDKIMNFITCTAYITCYMYKCNYTCI